MMGAGGRTGYNDRKKLGLLFLLFFTASSIDEKTRFDILYSTRIKTEN
jgi:hypothetical protein